MAPPLAATGWAESLEAMLDVDPRVLDAISPSDGEHFDPEVFICSRGTLYFLATGAGAGNSSALVAAFVEDLVETARRMAARSPGARLDPPLLLALDEIGNLGPLPSLPTLMAEGCGTEITTMPVLQSLTQARDKWSENQAAAIWDAGIAKISNAVEPGVTCLPALAFRAAHDALPWTRTDSCDPSCPFVPF